MCIFEHTLNDNSLLGTKNQKWIRYRLLLQWAPFREVVGWGGAGLGGAASHGSNYKVGRWTLNKSVWQLSLRGLPGLASTAVGHLAYSPLCPSWRTPLVFIGLRAQLFQYDLILTNCICSDLNFPIRSLAGFYTHNSMHNPCLLDTWGSGLIDKYMNTWEWGSLTRNGTNEFPGGTQLSLRVQFHLLSVAIAE